MAKKQNQTPLELVIEALHVVFKAVGVKYDIEYQYDNGYPELLVDKRVVVGVFDQEQKDGSVYFLYSDIYIPGSYHSPPDYDVVEHGDFKTAARTAVAAVQVCINDRTSNALDDFYMAKYEAEAEAL